MSLTVNPNFSTVDPIFIRSLTSGPIEKNEELLNKPKSLRNLDGTSILSTVLKSLREYKESNGKDTVQIRQKLQNELSAKYNILVSNDFLDMYSNPIPVQNEPKKSVKREKKVNNTQKPKLNIKTYQTIHPSEVNRYIKSNEIYFGSKIQGWIPIPTDPADEIIQGNQPF